MQKSKLWIFGDSFAVSQPGGWSKIVQEQKQVVNKSCKGSGPEWSLNILWKTLSTDISNDFCIIMLSHPGRLNLRGVEPDEQYLGQQDKKLMVDYVDNNISLLQYQHQAAAMFMCSAFKKALVWPIWGEGWVISSPYKNVQKVTNSLFDRMNKTGSTSINHANHLTDEDNLNLAQSVVQWINGRDFKCPWE